MPDDTNQLWTAYRQTRSEELRQQLILRYLSLIKYTAGRIRVKLPQHLDREDLSSYGLFGLIDAIEKFDPARGVKFETYAAQRIRGSILDELRNVSWAPRSITDKLRRVDQAYQRLEQVKGNEVSDQELASETGLRVEELEELWVHASYISTVSLEEFLLAGAAEDGIKVADTIPDHQSPDPEAVYNEQELESALVKSVEELPEKDRLILSLYYQERLTLKEIGKVLDVTESRVCQLHARALVRLRQKLKAYA